MTSIQHQSNYEWITLTEYLNRGNRIRDLEPYSAKLAKTNNVISSIASSEKEGYCLTGVLSKCSCRSNTLYKKEVPTDEVIVRVKKLIDNKEQ